MVINGKKIFLKFFTVQLKYKKWASPIIKNWHLSEEKSWEIQFTLYSVQYSTDVQ